MYFNATESPMFPVMLNLLCCEWLYVEHIERNKKSKERGKRGKEKGKEGYFKLT